MPRPCVCVCGLTEYTEGNQCLSHGHLMIFGNFLLHTTICPNSTKTTIAGSTTLLLLLSVVLSINCIPGSIFWENQCSSEFSLTSLTEKEKETEREWESDIEEEL